MPWSDCFALGNFSLETDLVSLCFPLPCWLPILSEQTLCDVWKSQLRKKKVKSKMNDEVSKSSWDYWLVRCGPFCDVSSLLKLRALNKFFFSVFSRNKLRACLGLALEDPQVDAAVTIDTCFLFFITFWDLFELRKKIHDTPWAKATRGVVQGAVRLLQYKGDIRSGVFKVTCMPSVKWAKKQRQTDLVRTGVDKPYVLEAKVVDGKAGRLSCVCPVG